MRTLFLTPWAAMLLLVPPESSGQWVQTNGPPGANVREFAVSGTSIFAGTWDGGVFRSTDNGANWTSVGFADTIVDGLAAIGTNIFVGTWYGPGAFRSTDNGASWTPINTGLMQQYGRPMDVLSLTASGTMLFATTWDGGVCRSTDKGESWTIVGLRGLSGGTDMPVRALAVSPPSGETGDTTLLAGTQGAGIYRSTDNGTTWSHVDMGMQRAEVHSFAVGPVDSATGQRNLFAGTYVNGVFLSTDNGMQWKPVNAGLNCTFVEALAFKGSKLFAGTDSGLFVSTNNGAGWAVACPELDRKIVTGVIVVGNSIFAGTELGGIVRSNDEAASWMPVNTGLSAITVPALAVIGNNVVAGTINPFRFLGGGNGVFLTTNAGTNWTPVNAGLTNPGVALLAAGPASKGTGAMNLFAATQGAGLFRSTDHGSSWTATGLSEKPVSALAFVGTDMFAGNGEGVFRSTDDGDTWTAANSGLTRKEVQGFAVVGPNLFASIWWGFSPHSGLFLSTNRGDSWTVVDTNIADIRVLGVRGNKLFAWTSEGVFMSSDNGTTWLHQCDTNAAVIRNVYPRAFTASGTNLFVGAELIGPSFSTDIGKTWESGVFLSTDDGKTWADVSMGLTSRRVRALAVDGKNLFAGMESGGVWRRPLVEMMTDVKDGDQPLPDHFALEQNYPNPFNAATTIEYTVGVHSSSFTVHGTDVKLTVYDLLGREVAVLVNEKQGPGRYSVQFDGSRLASGVYFYRLQAGSYSETRKLVLMR